MKTILFLFTTLITTICLSQSKHTTIDTETHKIIPYVSVFKNDTLIGITDKKGEIFLIDNNYTYKKDGYKESISYEKEIKLEKGFEDYLDEMIIVKPRKKTNRKFGKIEAHQVFMENLEFISFIKPKKNEINKRFYKISYQLGKRENFKLSESIFRFSIYNTQKEKIYYEYIETDSYDLIIIPNQEINIPKGGIYISLEYLGKTNSVNNPNDFFILTDLFYKAITFYKRNYLYKNNWETYEEIENNERFSTLYKNMPELKFTKFKNITPVFTIEFY